MNDGSSPQNFPGPISAAMIEELSRYVIADVYPFAVDLARCEGMWLMTVDGQRIFDWFGRLGFRRLRLPRFCRGSSCAGIGRGLGRFAMLGERRKSE